MDDPTKVLSKLRANKRIERKSSNLNQRLPKLNEWQNFPINDKIKFQVCYLLANFFTSVDVSKNDLCYKGKDLLCVKPVDEVKWEERKESSL